jgi:DNA helicase-2/ATP-dependent DNA helicase PcrA
VGRGEQLRFVLGARLAGPIDTFATLIKSFRFTAEQKDAYETAAHIAKTSGLLKELHEDKTVEGLARYENVQALLNAIKEFVDNPENEDKSLSAFLQSVSLLTSAEDDKDTDRDKVTMMTIHMAKGLEFKYVYIVGLEEDLVSLADDAHQPGRPGGRAAPVLRSHYAGRERS